MKLDLAAGVDVEIGFSECGLELSELARRVAARRR
jgi:hypothetical protein